ncbi:hypothetical protein CJ195_21380 [Bacillus sp. UMB0899]|nr:hypothetical protein CJ195_21380 [Bacillus sp. UMB0899]
MKVVKKGKLYQIIFLPGFFPVNCYLVEEPTSVTLIDTGIPSSFKGIIKVINEIGKPLKNIVLTHAHGDHVGSLVKLKTVFPTVPISISARDSRLLKGDKELEPHEEQTPIKGGIPKNIDLNPDQLLQEGDKIGSLVVVATPGHTPGSISLFDAQDRSIIVGDAFQTRGGIAVSGQLRPFFPFPAMATWSKVVALESGKKIYSLDPELLAVGHGEMIVSPKAAIQRAIEEAEQKLENRRER